MEVVPTVMSRLLSKSRITAVTSWSSEEDDLVLLAGLAVGVVEHDVAGVGEDADQARGVDGDAVSS
jgi:hypothetical protein